MGWWIGTLLVFEALSVGMIFAESWHFASFGYRLSPQLAVVLSLTVVLTWTATLRSRSGILTFAAITVSYVAGLAVAVHGFPLNYLRSDMLPVIGWADSRWLDHVNPYGTIHVGTRLYDFPYLPGMLVAYAPFVAAHLDLRIGTLSYLLASAVLIFFASRPELRLPAALCLGLFLLCPFLQYRHDLYLQAHWFWLTAAVVLMQRRQHAWAAAAWGCSMAIYQLSWVIFPFVLLSAYRRKGWMEVLKLTGISSLAALVVVVPFLRSATQRIASNTVGQWNLLPHALADPINISYWLTYLIRPDHLKWVQLAVLTSLFGYCVVCDCCRTLADTLRWMSCALAAFIPLNVLVDGYFYLTLLLLLLLYVFAANGWWAEPNERVLAGVPLSSESTSRT